MRVKEMANILLKTAIRALFIFTSRKQASERCARLADDYRALCAGLADGLGTIQVQVPVMRGVDPDMRNWSLFEVLEHNFIVNQSITATVCQLAEGRTLSGAALIDPKNDVMPGRNANEGIMEVFHNSILDHVSQVAKLGRLRGTPESPHPIFGSFDAHKWHCMFAFHLGLHLPQAKFVVDKAKANHSSAG